MQNFKDILGQPDAVASIARAYRAGRLPHGLVFAGPAGVGKATTARALAALFLCEEPQDGELPAACGRCESCRVFEAGTHPDFHLVTRDLIRYHDKTGKSKGIDLSIHVVRPELIEPASRKAAMGRGKAFVVEEAETMNPPAQNALLKTLEEPAGRTVIVLLTDQPGALLPTVRSRCQVIRFAALPQDLVRRELKKRGLDDETAADAARLAGGSLGVALKWVQDGVVGPARELAGQIDALFTAGRPPEDLPGWFKRAADAYAEKQLERDKLGSKDAATREGLGLYLRVIGEQARRRLAQAGEARELERACAAIDAVARAEMSLDANVNVPVIFHQLAVALEGLGAGAAARR